MSSPSRWLAVKLRQQGRLVERYSAAAAEDRRALAATRDALVARTRSELARPRSLLAFFAVGAALGAISGTGSRLVHTGVRFYALAHQVARYM